MHCWVGGLKNPFMPPDTEIRSWLRLFAQWLHQSQSTRSKHKPIQTYDRWTEGDERVLESRLSLLADDDPRFHRPGAIATWNLVNRTANEAGVLITLDNLYQLSTELKSNKTTEALNRGLERSTGLTHRFQVSWVFKTSQKLQFIVIDSFDIDLANQFVDEAPKDIIRYTALDAFSMRVIPTMGWKERIYHFPWYESIRHLAPRKGCPENPKYRRLCKRIQRVTLT